MMEVAVLKKVLQLAIQMPSQKICSVWHKTNFLNALLLIWHCSSLWWSFMIFSLKILIKNTKSLMTLRFMTTKECFYLSQSQQMMVGGKNQRKVPAALSCPKTRAISLTWLSVKRQIIYLSCKYAWNLISPVQTQLQRTELASILLQFGKLN